MYCCTVGIEIIAQGNSVSVSTIVFMGLLSKIYSLLFLFTTCVSSTIIDNISLFSFLFTIRSMYRVSSYYSKESIVPVSTFFISNPIQYCKPAYDRSVRVEMVASVTPFNPFDLSFPFRKQYSTKLCATFRWIVITCFLATT